MSQRAMLDTSQIDQPGPGDPNHNNISKAQAIADEMDRANLNTSSQDYLQPANKVQDNLPVSGKLATK